MRNAVAFQYEHALEMAEELRSLLKPYCHRIEIAGSIRRKRREPNDIELVCIPKKSRHFNLLNDATDELLLNGTLEKRPDSRGNCAWGDRFKRAVFFRGPSYMQADIFSVLPPAQWGVIFAIRTGPWKFNRVLVTDRRLGGACPEDLKIAGGQVWYIGDCENNYALSMMPSNKFLKVADDVGARTRPVESERHFFDILGVPWWDPEDRFEERLHFWLREQKECMSCSNCLC